MEKKAEAYIKRYHMIERGDHVIAAVSGGADSVCLLHLLASLSRRMGFEIQVVHVHHGLRGQEADRDAGYVKELSDRWRIPCHVVYRDVAAYGREHGLSVEEAGRDLRYKALQESAAHFDNARIAVAHHQDDQAETILHNLFRGSGLRGLGGMAPVRGNIIRPLLWAGRREILDYLERYGIDYCEDSTNGSLDYTRNKLRRKVIPMICGEVNPGAVQHIVSAGEHLRQANAYFQLEAERIWHEHRIIRDEKGRRGIKAQALTELPEILRGYVVMEMIRELTGCRKDIASAHVWQLLDLAEKGTGRMASLPYGLTAQKEYDVVWLMRGNGEREREEEVCLTMESFPADILREKYQKIPENKYTKWFDYDKIKGTLSVRTRRTGDYYTLKDGRKKTVKSFMIDAKIPREDRDKIPLLAEGQHVLWIVGYRISEFYKVTDETKRILQVSTDGGKEHEG